MKAYSAALVAGQGKKAYPMLSAHCRTVITSAAFQALAAQAHATYPKAKIITLSVTDVGAPRPMCPTPTGKRCSTRAGSHG